MEVDSTLKLDNQLCFPLYAASRLVTRMYQPLLKGLGITYPQYLILMVLWENDGLSVTSIGEKLMLDTNTLTPLLKRMENKNILTRERSKEDERRVIIRLTDRGTAMKKEAHCIPGELAKSISDDFTLDKVIRLKEDLNQLISLLQR